MSADAVRQVLSDYYAAFARDPAEAAAFYGEPTLFVSPDRVFVLDRRAEIEAWMGASLARLKSAGYASTQLDTPQVKFLTATTALCATVAVRLKADGAELQRAGFTYLLAKGSSGWKIHQAIVTDLDRLGGR